MSTSTFATDVLERHAARDAAAALRQFDEFKARYPGYVLLFRLGDFYEAFRDDAATVNKITGVALTTSAINGEPVAMAGVPHGRVECYLRKLIAAGHRVALCEPAKA